MASEHKLPPGCEQPINVSLGGGPSYVVRRRGDRYITRPTPQDAVAASWRKWERHSGLTRSEHEQRERAVEFMRGVSQEGCNYVRRHGKCRDIDLDSRCTPCHAHALLTLTEAETHKGEQS